MRYYKVVKFCGICNKRFFVIDQKGAAQHYCKECYEKYKKPENKSD